MCFRVPISFIEIYINIFLAHLQSLLKQLVRVNERNFGMPAKNGLYTKLIDEVNYLMADCIRYWSIYP